MTIISSSEQWVDTGIDVAKGRVYRYVASGVWKDGSIKTDADGYEIWYLRPFGILKRVNHAKWFQLIITIGKDLEYIVPLGRSGTFSAPSSGRVWAFANDAGFRYGNNSGSVDLDIQIHS